MRHLILPAAGLLVATFLSACASGPPAGTRVVELERLDEVVFDDQGPYVIRISEGTRLPVQVTVDTPFVRTEEGAAPVHAVFERTVYWSPRHADMISFDGETWQAFNDGHEGRVSFGLGKSSEGGVSGSVSVGLTPDD